MTPEAPVRTVEDFLPGARDAVVLDDGAVVLDLAQAKYSISGERNQCLLDLWPEERNVVRRVLEVEIKNEVLRLAVQRLGPARPSKLEICRPRDRRTPTAKRAARLAYQQSLQFAGDSVSHVYGITAYRLRRSGAIVRPDIRPWSLATGGVRFCRHGREPAGDPSSIDAALTFGILWLDVCRETQAGKIAVHGLKLFLPEDTSAWTRERMAHLHSGAAKWQLYELENREDRLQEIDVSDRGNVRTRLVRLTDEAAARERFAEAISEVRELMPEAETAVPSPAGIAFRCHRLEFARARLAHPARLT